MTGFWRFYLKRLCWSGLLCVWLVCGSWTLAQNIEITSPESKEVTPGDFVTLVFRLETSQNTTLEATATSSLGWEILRQPGTIELTANKSKPLALTITVPNNAAAGTAETITLNVGDEKSVSVNLTVKENRVLELQTPVDLILGKDVLTVLLSNKGNVPDEVTLELLSTGVLEEQRILTLEPLSEREELFEIDHEGLYIVKLTNTTGLELTKAVNVIRFGVPEPQPFALVGEANAGINTGLAWGTSLALGGSLSDDWVFDSFLEAPRWRRSFASLDSDAWGVRIGFSEAPRPFFNNFPQPFGLSGRYTDERASLLGAFGWLGGSQWSGYIAPAIELDGARVAVGTGLSAGQVVAGASYYFKYPNGETYIALSHLPGGFNTEVEVEVFDIPGKLAAQANLTHLGGRDASFGVQADFNLDSFIAYAGATLPLGPDAIGDYSLGISNDIPADVSGTLGFGVQFSSLSQGATLRYSTPLGNGWQTNNQLGAFFDKDGFGVSLDTHWTAYQQNYLSIDGQLIIRGNKPLAGTLGARLEVPFAVVRAYGETEWNIGESNVGVSAGASWKNETLSFEVLSGLNYNYAGDVTPFSAELALRGAYLFTLQVPESLTESFGGRNLGRLSGVVRAGDLPVPDIQLELDRYTLVTDETGAFTADLPPGEYEVKLDSTTLPITIRLMSEDTATITLERGRETELVFEAAATAAIAGRVLEDANADGVADENGKVVPAQLVLTDSEGLRRSVFSNETEGFLVRGLLPGTARLKVSNLPLGSTLVGSDTLELSLKAGEISEVTFLAVPPTTVSQTFTKSDLRIRRISTEVDRVPANTAPLVGVKIQGEAERVTLQSETGTYEMTFDGEDWEVRLPIPATATDLYPFTVVAYQGEGQTDKKSQIIIDQASPWAEVTVASPVKPNSVITVDTLGYFAVKDVQIQSELGFTFETVGNDEGHFISTATIPETAEDKVYTLTITVTGEEGQTFTREETFRVLIQ